MPVERDLLNPVRLILLVMAGPRPGHLLRSGAGGGKDLRVNPRIESGDANDDLSS